MAHIITHYVVINDSKCFEIFNNIKFFSVEEKNKYQHNFLSGDSH